MNTLSVTGILKDYKLFNRDFWLAYKTLEKLLPKERFEEIKLKLMKTKIVHPDYLEGLDLLTYETEKQLLAAEWKAKSDEAKELGSKLHEIIHNMFCTDLLGVKTNLGIDTELYKVQSTELFLKSDKGIFPEFKLEIKIDDDFILIGIADLIIKNGNSITIVDWKSNDKITTRSYYDVGKKREKSFKYPINHLMDCDLVLYLLQVSMYAWMLLLLNPDFKIDCLKIVQIKDFKVKKEFVVDYLHKDVDKLIKWHVKNTKLQNEMKKCREIRY